jgi:hypothetical protein
VTCDWPAPGSYIEWEGGKRGANAGVSSGERIIINWLRRVLGDGYRVRSEASKFLSSTSLACALLRWRVGPSVY